MLKKSFALAFLTLASAGALAQSSESNVSNASKESGSKNTSISDNGNVHIFGVVEVAGESRGVSGVNRNSKMVSDLSYIGLKMSESLSVVGLKTVGARLEMQFQPDTGVTTPSLRTSTLEATTHNWGQFAVGKQQSTYVKATESFDYIGVDSQGSHNAIFGRSVFSNPSTANSSVGLNVRQSNALSWTSPMWKNTTLHASYAFNEKANTGDMSTRALGLTYYRGNWSAAAVAQRQEYSGVVLPTGDNIDTGVKAFIGYNFGSTQLSVGAERLKQDINNSARAISYTRNAYTVGARHEKGVHQLSASYTVADKGQQNLAFTPDMQASQLAVGYRYTLSKRTSIFANASWIDNHTGANYDMAQRPVTFLAPGARVSNFGLGLRHSF